MSFLSDAPEKAQSSPTELQAARLYNRLDHELNAADNEDDYQAGERAQSILRERFPGVENHARQVTQPPRLSQKARKALYEASSTPLRAQTVAQHRAGGRVQRTLRRRISHATAIHARPRRRGGGGGGLASSRTRQAATGVGQTIVRAVEGVVGLVLLGLLVSDRGSTAISEAGGGLGKFLGKLASPHDPLFTAHASGSGGGDIPFIPPNTRNKPPGSGGGKHRLPRLRHLPPLPPPSPVRPPVGSPWEAPIPDIPVPVLP